MVNLATLLSITSIAVGFVAGICFCIGAATNKIKDIALSSATIVGGNPAHMKSLSAQKAQYLIGALFLVISFCFQAGAVLIPKESKIPLPPFLQLPPVQFFAVLLVASAIAFFAISRISKGTEEAARKYLKDLIEAQKVRKS